MTVEVLYPNRLGNYTKEGNYEYANVTDKPLGDEWNSTAKKSKNDSNASNATANATEKAAKLVFMKSDVHLANDTAPTVTGDCSQH
jgi:hypothetical protein